MTSLMRKGTGSTMTDLDLLPGKPNRKPSINVWLEPGTGPDSIYIRAKHSEDAADQLIAVIHKDEDGSIFIETRKLFTPNLKEAFDICNSRIVARESKEGENG